MDPFEMIDATHLDEWWMLFIHEEWEGSDFEGIIGVAMFTSFSMAIEFVEESDGLTDERTITLVEVDIEIKHQPRKD